VACLLLGCCTPPECRPEAIPHRGRARTLEEFFQVVQYLALHDCCENLHRNLSQGTRDEYGETKFCLFWESIDLPEYGYALADVVRGGRFLAGVEGPGPGEQFLYVEYEEPGKSNLLARILVLTQGDEEDPSPRPRIALTEQVRAIDERKDARYWWDAGGGPQ
jgi:hypothetical protein